MKMKYLDRDIEKIVKAASRRFPAVIVTGPRQSGKTTLLNHIFADSHTYVSMDNPDTRLMAINEPPLFFDNYKPPLIIDEIQYAPELLSYIKILIDKNRKKAGQFILTGSQLFPMMAKVGESLAGRIAVFTLLSFSIREQFGLPAKLSLDVLKKRVLTGGFPDVVLGNNINPELWFSGYLQTYLERDVRQLRQVGDLTDFQRFLQLAAAYNGQAINLSSISRDLGIAVNTVKAWFSILETSGQIALIKPFYLNKGKRIIKSPKLYFLDTGLLCYLAGLTSVKQIFKGPMAGQFLETAVLGEIVRSFYNKGRISRVFWYKTSDGSEVDFVVEREGKILPIEVKLSSQVNTAMAKSLFSFCKLFAGKTEKAFVVNLSPERLSLGRDVESIPFSSFVDEL
ncbi:MAG: ATP-binding protein [Candidatus Omnitrophota bacterium]